MIVIVDYGMGNLRSAQKGFEKAGFEALISEDPAHLAAASGVVLPGVGAFGDCYEGLRTKGFIAPLMEAVEQGKPLLGICVGMQLLFDGSEEGGGCEGLGILPGQVVRFQLPEESGLKVPHMGWNQLSITPQTDCPLFAHTSPRPYVYFVHSYYPQPADPAMVYATAEHGVEFAAAAGTGRVFALQFHPEKSQKEGIGILRAFGDYVQRAGQSATVDLE